MAEKKVSVSVSIPPLRDVNPRVKKIAAGLIVVLAALGVYTLGHNAGYDKGYAAGTVDGTATGDKAGFERGYWLGREDGCNFVFDQTGTPYVVGETNPHATFYFLLGLGDTYLDRGNCSTFGHGSAPYSGGPSTTN